MKKQITLFLLLIVATMLNANNIAVTNIKLTGQNTTDDYTLVQFDISWENSWRTTSAPNNWDAAWIFVKYRIKTANGGDGIWHHAWLNNTGHAAPSGSSVEIGLLDPASAFNSSTNPGLGTFVYRDAAGTGTFTKTGLQLRWNYGQNYKTGTTPIGDNDAMDVQVFAVEMVYVPAGSFFIGSGGIESGAFYKYPATSNPYLITSENEIIVGTATDNLFYQNTSGYSGDQSGPIPAGFPKGYNAFYCMKYEITQQDYVEFLNCLSQTQADTRKCDKPDANYRYEISGNQVGNYTTTNPFVACNFLNYSDLAAWLDWSGLRPMTELEFEKACRGTKVPATNEYAWGSINAAAATGLNNAGSINETASNSDANVCFYNSGTGGPVRGGLFATPTSAREAAGATYYGIMEMSGNVWEQPVSTGHSVGRAFTGTHGDGALNATGDADALSWPGNDATGSSFRGGDWHFIVDDSRVSERTYAANGYNVRAPHFGGRGVRSTISCGYYTINHEVLGGVAPVGKTVTYQTVTNIPGESSKCWITSNLGADHQASAVNDATEESAGWYWQFDHKQGYMHDGTTRTPNIAWITNIPETSDWAAENDPCAIELGSGWRIPTRAEYSNIILSGTWTDWNGPFESPLKIHVPGYLIFSNGNLLGDRGNIGVYWSGTSNYCLYITSSNTFMNYDNKAYGFSMRCLKEPEVAPFVCGSSSITVNHIGGDGIAPVTKTATYGTVTNIPGETSKCWITSNLGADHQASSVDDASEESAGWYWQFNRKQGYKNDGTTLTPAWTITSINEDLNWQPDNDPCAIELGIGWRIPTSTEWTNVDASDNWIDRNGPWNSNLKMHAAGYLINSDGSLSARGSTGFKWSSTQNNTTNGMDLYYDVYWSGMDLISKAYGFSLRCLKEPEVAPFVCGSSSITVNHIGSDGIAPVTKTATYGTVTNIPGETSKCWITSNLGADHQAASVDDATEESAGWYWQFNRKQGYKVDNDGTTRTPNSTWITSIDENSDWAAENDPCANELGSGWRIPTGTEWTNVDAGGNWTEWTGPYNSDLKLHAAGAINFSDGLLFARGSDVSYSSNTQYSTTQGWGLNFGNSGYCYVIYNVKTYGLSLRCLKEPEVASFSIGQSYGGGIIFYIDASGQHGLIASTTDQSTGTTFGCDGTLIGTSTNLGTGQTNTTAIVNGCATLGIPAKLCDELSLNGYDDWFLPSKDELYQMYLQKAVIGEFSIWGYWSSSEDDANSAWIQGFVNGDQINTAKYGSNYVRAIRAF